MAQFQTSSPLGLVTRWAVSTRAFRRNRIEPDKKVLAAGLCNSGYSYRDVAEMLGDMSYVAARDCFVALASCFPTGSKEYRVTVAIDEADVRFGQRTYRTWLARDGESGELLSFYASPDGSVEDGAGFLASVGRVCSNRPVLRFTCESPSSSLLNLDLYFQPLPNPSIISRLGRLILRSP